jgi:outer membrane protein OmpA-like peptidoglycan-associated protein
MVSKLLTLVLIVTCTGFVRGQIYDFTTPQRMGSFVNTSADESNPVLASNDSLLYFVRTFDANNVGGIYDQDIWTSKRENGQWNKPKPLNMFNNKLNNAVISEQINTKDSTENLLFLLTAYGTEKDTKKGISVSTKKANDTLWSAVNRLPIPDLDIDGKYVSYFLSADQSALVFSFEGSGSEGEEDLYYALKTAEGWSIPEHLGAAINSPGFEISPFLTAGNDTLFFSSNGFKGLGDADIYYSVRKGKWNNWTKPMNLGKTINTPYFDAYFSLKNNKAMWSSNREGKDLDIWNAWAIAPPKLTHTSSLKDVSEFQGNDGQVDITVTSGIPPYKYTWSNGLTTQDLTNARKGEYKVTILDSIGQKLQLAFTLNEPPAQEQNLIRFPNIQYAFNKWSFVNDSTVNSYDSLKSVAKLLQDYPKLTIELISHTDARGDLELNQILSENRAKSCYIYLVNELHIDPRRIVPIGKGESEPANWFDPSTQSIVKLTEDFINAKKENTGLFEYLNQLNRRTEGRVLRLDFDPKSAAPAPKSYMEFQILPR